MAFVHVKQVYLNVYALPFYMCSSESGENGAWQGILQINYWRRIGWAWYSGLCDLAIRVHLQAQEEEERTSKLPSNSSNTSMHRARRTTVLPRHPTFVWCRLLQVLPVSAAEGWHVVRPAPLLLRHTRSSGLLQCAGWAWRLRPWWSWHRLRRRLLLRP